MNPNAATDQDALYSVYLNGDWAGPYRVNQIRDLVAQGTIATDAIAYAAAQERHYMVEELLAASTPVETKEIEKTSPADSITQGRHYSTPNRLGSPDNWRFLKPGKVLCDSAY